MLLPRLRAIRERKTLTQKELAELAGVAVGTVQRTEAGEDCRPRTARKLAQALNVEASELMGPITETEGKEVAAA